MYAVLHVRRHNNRIKNKMGQTDLEQKSSADEREAYIGTLSEETVIE